MLAGAELGRKAAPLGACENPAVGTPHQACGRGAMGARRALTAPQGRQLRVRASGPACLTLGDGEAPVLVK